MKKVQGNIANNGTNIYLTSDTLDIVTLPQKYKVNVSTLSSNLDNFQLLLDYKEGIPKCIANSIENMNISVIVKDQLLLDSDMIREGTEIFPNLKTFNIHGRKITDHGFNWLTAFGDERQSLNSYSDHLDLLDRKDSCMISIRNVLPNNKGITVVQKSGIFLLKINSNWVCFSCSGLIATFNDKERLHLSPYYICSYDLNFNSIKNCKICYNLPDSVKEGINHIGSENDYKMILFFKYNYSIKFDLSTFSKLQIPLGASVLRIDINSDFIDLNGLRSTKIYLSISNNDVKDETIIKICEYFSPKISIDKTSNKSYTNQPSLHQLTIGNSFVKSEATKDCLINFIKISNTLKEVAIIDLNAHKLGWFRTLEQTDQKTKLINFIESGANYKSYTQEIQNYVNIFEIDI